jgi:hypothetical protein
MSRSHAPQGPNKIGKAIYESDQMRGIAQAETRKRKNWAYVTVAYLEDWAKTQTVPSAEGEVVPKADEVLARELFGVRLDAPVRRGGTPELFAVWRVVDRDPLDSELPQFELDAVEAAAAASTIVAATVPPSLEAASTLPAPPDHNEDDEDE